MYVLNIYTILHKGEESRKREKKEPSLNKPLREIYYLLHYAFMQPNWNFIY